MQTKISVCSSEKRILVAIIPGPSEALEPEQPRQHVQTINFLTFHVENVEKVNFLTRSVENVEKIKLWTVRVENVNFRTFRSES